MNELRDEQLQVKAIEMLWEDGWTIDMIYRTIKCSKKFIKIVVK